MNTPRSVAQAVGRVIRLLAGRVRRRRGPTRPPSGDLAVNDRERLISRILSTTHNNSILLRGAPGSGKTSTLLQLKDRLTGGGPDAELFPVYIDLHGVPERLLFTTVERAVSEQLPLASTLGVPLEAESAAPGAGHRELARFFRGIIRTLAEERCRPVRMVLLVDGIDQLNNYSQRTTQRVRSLFMAGLGGNLVMVASAVEIDRHWEQEGSPWYNFLEEIELTPVADDEASDRVRDRMPRNGPR